MTTLRQLRGAPGTPPPHPINDRTKKMRETFQDAPSKNAYRINGGFPRSVVEIGKGKSLAYTSNKWKAVDDFEDFKHIAEGPQRVFIPAREAGQRLLSRTRSGDQFPEMDISYTMPPVLAELAPCLFVEVQPFDQLSGRHKTFSDRALRLEYNQAILYGGYALRPGGDWDNKRDTKPFLCVMSKRDGFLTLITGKKLDVTKDGVVG